MGKPTVYNVTGGVDEELLEVIWRGWKKGWEPLLSERKTAFLQYIVKIASTLQKKLRNVLLTKPWVEVDVTGWIWAEEIGEMKRVQSFRSDDNTRITWSLRTASLHICVPTEQCGNTSSYPVSATLLPHSFTCHGLMVFTILLIRQN